MTEESLKVESHLLTITWFAILSLGTMDKRRGFGVETVQAIWMLVNKGVILRNKLPSNFGRDDRCGGGVRHAMNQVSLLSIVAVLPRIEVK